MKLIDALEVVNRPLPEDAPNLEAFLACGFMPLHLRTFLSAQLRIRFPGHRVNVGTGVYGDLIGNIERLNQARPFSLGVVIEWGDLDSRLTIRSLGGWRSESLKDIENSFEKAAVRLTESLSRVSGHVPTIVCLPTLPLPPISSPKPDQLSPFEARLRHTMLEVATALCVQPGICIANSQLLDEMSPPGERFDVKSEVLTGFPYSLHHAEVLATILSRLIQGHTSKKGLITDLDDTLWAGILGEDGINGISWHLEHQTHLHGLYQQFLASLASAGVLIGVASKNDPGLVERAFERNDLLISRKDIFPCEAHWHQKSQSVRRILNAWNIGADTVVFIDDSPMEVAEVQSTFPELECIVFPKNDYKGLWNLLHYLRGVFGKRFLTDEDSLRLHSIRDSNAWREFLRCTSASSDDFLRDAESSIIFSCFKEGTDGRAFELVNKTNQFNLNGRRFSESEWLSYLDDPTAVLLTASYEDKYGFLGKIAVIMGVTGNHRLTVNAWVMSCRAFSRRIEHQCLKFLFEKFNCDEIVLDYRPTPRNGPLQEFIVEVTGTPPSQRTFISRELFERNVLPLFHQVVGDFNV